MANSLQEQALNLSREIKLKKPRSDETFTIASVRDALNFLDDAPTIDQFAAPAFLSAVRNLRHAEATRQWADVQRATEVFVWVTKPWAAD